MTRECIETLAKEYLRIFRERNIPTQICEGTPPTHWAVKAHAHALLASAMNLYLVVTTDEICLLSAAVGGAQMALWATGELTWEEISTHLLTGTVQQKQAAVS
jgi:hypothetical protein